MVATRGRSRANGGGNASADNTATSAGVSGNNGGIKKASKPSVKQQVPSVSQSPASPSGSANSAKGRKGKCAWDFLRQKHETKSMRDKYIASSCQLFFRRDPLKMVRGSMQYMYEQDGTEYLDCINNVAHVGHCHPHVVQAGFKQMRTLQTNNRYLHDHIVTLAERLCSTLPSQLCVCFFVNSGSEANDLAQRLALYYTKNRDGICLDHAYHGHVMSCIGISPYKFMHGGSEEKKPDHIHVVPTPDRYRGKYRDDQMSMSELTDAYVGEVQSACDSVAAAGRGVSFFISESMQSCGGQVIFPPGYLRRVYDIVRRSGGVCIADEVQTGFGRVGSKWWAFQLDDDQLVPDIVTIGKPMGNGHPISAVITTPAIAEAFRRGPDYFNTYGGNPVSCAIALAVLDVIEQDKLRENAVRVGEHLKRRLQEMQPRHPMMGDVRGAGMFLGIDMVLCRRTRQPAGQAAETVLWRLRSEHIIMSLDGPHENILKFKPPMCFSLANANQLCDTLDRIFTEVEADLAASAAAAAAATAVAATAATAAAAVAAAAAAAGKPDREKNGGCR
ncbi:hypothetical protein BOX15_Mlig027304g1 [Macrostomum lignano]|uniref:Uncharacterized protein n=1 Tax=Macrostomum lignano TaxID=282301 RepID=A0A267G1A5_9PLAT|nr:hypothetical protein BOX15_Mlig017311g1 [Macrostomum lignano]PAA79885.1 hypothetical protein BOX15_Mlig027304g1 [Macrostomum lignano]